MSTDELERKRFEDWERSRYVTAFDRRPIGSWGDESGEKYEGAFVQCAWEAWQAQSARIAELEAECQRLREQLAKDDDRMGEMASKAAEERLVMQSARLSAMPDASAASLLARMDMYAARLSPERDGGKG